MVSSMSSLADLPELVGFFSYSRDDDIGSHGALSALRERIQHELRAQLGRSFKGFRLWQDKEAIASGKLWEWVSLDTGDPRVGWSTASRLDRSRALVGFHGYRSKRAFFGSFMHIFRRRNGKSCRCAFEKVPATGAIIPGPTKTANSARSRYA
jgi:hypothetical protein